MCVQMCFVPFWPGLRGVVFVLGISEVWCLFLASACMFGRRQSIRMVTTRWKPSSTSFVIAVAFCSQPRPRIVRRLHGNPLASCLPNIRAMRLHLACRAQEQKELRPPRSLCRAPPSRDKGVGPLVWEGLAVGAWMRWCSKRTYPWGPIRLQPSWSTTLTS